MIDIETAKKNFINDCYDIALLDINSRSGDESFSYSDVNEHPSTWKDIQKNGIPILGYISDQETPSVDSTTQYIDGFLYVVYDGKEFDLYIFSDKISYVDIDIVIRRFCKGVLDREKIRLAMDYVRL